MTKTSLVDELRSADWRTCDETDILDRAADTIARVRDRIVAEKTRWLKTRSVGASASAIINMLDNFLDELDDA